VTATIFHMSKYHSQAYAFLVRDVVQRMLLCTLVLCALRFLVFRWTNSMASLADALNSVVTLIASAVMLYSIWARQPRASPDAATGSEGTRGEYLAFGLEGWAILSIGLYVSYQSLLRIFPGTTPSPQLAELGLGIGMLLAIAGAAAGLAAWVWFRGKSFKSILLIAAAKHLIADVVSTLAVVLGLLLVQSADLPWLDPLVALLVAFTVLWASWKLLWKSVSGLTDELEREIDPTLRALLDTEVRNSAIVGYDNLRVRFNGPRRWVEVRLLVDPKLTIQAGRELGAIVEQKLRTALGEATVVARVEPKADQVATTPVSQVEKSEADEPDEKASASK